MTSLLSGIPVEPDVAMTGEITLRGHVLPIGGVKEKVLAAFRFGSKVVLLPRDNEKDLAELPEDVTSKLEIHLIDTMDDVLRYALTEAVGVSSPDGKKKADKSLPSGSGESVTH